MFTGQCCLCSYVFICAACSNVLYFVLFSRLHILYVCLCVSASRSLLLFKLFDTHIQLSLFHGSENENFSADINIIEQSFCYLP